MTRQAVVETPRVRWFVRWSFVLRPPLVCGTSSCPLSRQDCLLAGDPGVGASEHIRFAGTSPPANLLMPLTRHRAKSDTDVRRVAKQRKGPGSSRRPEAAGTSGWKPALLLLC